MFNFLVKKKVTDINERSIDEFRDLINVLRNSNEPYQEAVGNGFNLANSQFYDKFRDRASYLKLSLDERVRVLDQFREWANAVQSKDPGASTGIFVFSRALSYIAFEDHDSEQTFKTDFEWLILKGGGGMRLP